MAYGAILGQTPIMERDKNGVFYKTTEIVKEELGTSFKQFQIDSSNYSYELSELTAAVDANGKIFYKGSSSVYSLDCKTLQVTTLPIPAWNEFLRVGNRIFSYTGGMVHYTDDFGASWQSKTIPSNLTRPVYNGSKFFIFGTREVYSSNDGLNWTLQGNTTYYLKYVIGGNNILVGVYQDDDSGQDVLVYSSNGVNWSKPRTSIEQYKLIPSFTNGMFIYVSNGGYLFTSTDGANWTQKSSGKPGYEGQFLFVDGKYYFSNMSTSDAHKVIVYNSDWNNLTSKTTNANNKLSIPIYDSTTNRIFFLGQSANLLSFYTEKLLELKNEFVDYQGNKLVIS